jgi:hypothetical protein
VRPNRSFDGFTIGIGVLARENVGEIRRGIARVLEQHTARTLNTHFTIPGGGR